MTASRTDRLEAQVTRLAELLDIMHGTTHMLEAVFDNGYRMGRESIIGERTAPHKIMNGSGTPKPTRHLRVVP